MKRLIPLAAFAAGCSFLPSVGPDYTGVDVETPETPVPDAGMPTTNLNERGEFASAPESEDPRRILTAQDIAGWWRKFGDPVLDGIVEAAVTNNISFLMAQERLIASRWELIGTYSAFMPEVDASAGFTRSEKGKYTSSMAGTGRTLHRDVFSAGFDASWEIDIFGGSRRSTESALASAEAKELDVQDAWVSLTAEAGLQYIKLRTVQERIAVARKNLALQIETYEILKSRMESGIGDELAVSQSQYTMSQTHATIPPLLAEEEELKNAIAILTGEMPGTLHARLDAIPERDWMLEPVRLKSIPLDLIRTRPDVRSAERSFAAQVAAVGVAKSMWYPKLYINGSLGLESVRGADLLKRGALYGSLGPSFSWPIFQGGKIYSSVKAEEAKMREACLNYELAVENAYGDVRDAYASYTQEYHKHQALEAAVKAAQNAVSISNDLYKNGLKDFTAVIDAQRSLLSLEESLVISRGQIVENLISLYKALGGGLAMSGADDGDERN